ncbi:hypothetical protein LP417_35275 (plasmid) [Polaromonas sp. P1-6]|nr:hypothetical protein LP417_35275 [Polaromonas sp. P1-6]
MNPSTIDSVKNSELLSQYIDDHALSLKASLLCAFYAEALKRSEHQFAFDAASFHHANMLGANAIPQSDAPAIIDAFNEQTIQVLRCETCRSMFLSISDSRNEHPTQRNCLPHR